MPVPLPSDYAAQQAARAAAERARQIAIAQAAAQVAASQAATQAATQARLAAALEEERRRRAAAQVNYAMTEDLKRRGYPIEFGKQANARPSGAVAPHGQTDYDRMRLAHHAKGLVGPASRHRIRPGGEIATGIVTDVVNTVLPVLQQDPSVQLAIGEAAGHAFYRDIKPMAVLSTVLVGVASIATIYHHSKKR